ARPNRSQGIVTPAARLSGCALMSACWRAARLRSTDLPSTAVVVLTTFIEFTGCIKSIRMCASHYSSRQDLACWEDARLAFIAVTRLPLYADMLVLSPVCLTR